MCKICCRLLAKMLKVIVNGAANCCNAFLLYFTNITVNLAPYHLHDFLMRESIASLKFTFSFLNIG